MFKSYLIRFGVIFFTCGGLISCSSDHGQSPSNDSWQKPQLKVIRSEKVTGGESQLDGHVSTLDSFDIQNANGESDSQISRIEINSECVAAEKLEKQKVIFENFESNSAISVFNLIPPRTLLNTDASTSFVCTFDLTLTNKIGSTRVMKAQKYQVHRNSQENLLVVSKTQNGSQVSPLSAPNAQDWLREAVFTQDGSLEVACDKEGIGFHLSNAAEMVEDSNTVEQFASLTKRTVQQAVQQINLKGKEAVSVVNCVAIFNSQNHMRSISPKFLLVLKEEKLQTSSCVSFNNYRLLQDKNVELMRINITNSNTFTKTVSLPSAANLGWMYPVFISANNNDTSSLAQPISVSYTISNGTDLGETAENRFFEVPAQSSATILVKVNFNFAVSNYAPMQNISPEAYSSGISFFAGMNLLFNADLKISIENLGLNSSTLSYANHSQERNVGSWVQSTKYQIPLVTTTIRSTMAGISYQGVGMQLCP